MVKKRSTQLAAAILSASMIMGQSQNVFAVDDEFSEEVLIEEELAEEELIEEEVIEEELIEEAIEEPEEFFEESSAADITEVENLSEEKNYAENEVVCLADSIEQAESIAEAYGGELKSFSYGVAVIDLANSELTVEEACTNVPAEVQDSVFVEPNYLFSIDTGTAEEPAADDKVDLPDGAKLTSTSKGSFDAIYGKVFNDPNLHPTSYSYQYFHDYIGSFDAWRYTTGDKKIVVAMIDTGVYAGHPELKKRIVGSNWNGNSNTDDSGLGTYHAGIVACEGNDGIGGVGIAPGVSILPVRVTDKNGDISNELLLQGYRYIAGFDKSGKKISERRADVACVSFAETYYSANQEKAVQECIESGITMVAPVGNNNCNEIVYPAAYKNVIGVGAVSRTGAKEYSSNYGSLCDISAYGFNIRSITMNSDGYIAVIDDSSLSACPIVVGACALYMSYVGHVSPKAMEKVLKNNASHISDPDMGAGIVNVGKMICSSEKAKKSGLPVTAAENASISVDGQNIISPGSKATFKLIKNPKNLKLGKITWSLKNQPAGVEINPKGVVTVKNGVKPAENIEVIALAPGKNALYTAKTIFSVTEVSPNSKVTISADRKYLATTAIHALHKEAYLTATADVDVSRIRWYSSDPAVATVSGVGKNAVVTALTPGTVTITAKSNDGGKAKAKIKITVITPASGLTVTTANRQMPYVLTSGGTITYKAVLGTAYGPVTKNKIDWGYGYSIWKNGRVGSISDKTEKALKAKKAFCTFKNGTLKVKSQKIIMREMEKYSKEFPELEGCTNIEIYINAYTTDGTGFSGGDNVFITRSDTYLSFTRPGGKERKSVTAYVNRDFKLPFYTDIYANMDVNYQVTSSNPEVCSGYRSDETGITVQPRKKGTAILIVKACDGSKKTAKIKVKVE